MHCTVHPDAPAQSTCVACERAACAECLRRVGEAHYCEPCLVSRLQPPPPLAVSQPLRPRQVSPFLAAALSLVPGLGQVYCGLVGRGLAHFVIMLLLVKLMGGSGWFAPVIVLAGLVYYFWQVGDAWGTAKDVNRLGHAPTPDEARALGRGPLPGVGDGGRGLPIALIVVGGVFLLQNLGLGERLTAAFARVWPFALVIAGTWLLLRDRSGRGRIPPTEPPATAASS